MQVGSAPVGSVVRMYLLDLYRIYTLLSLKETNISFTYDLTSYDIIILLIHIIRYEITKYDLTL